MRQSGRGVDRVLIIGAGEVGRAVMRNIIAQPELGYRVIGFLDDDPSKASTDIGPIKAFGPIENVPQVVKENTSINRKKAGFTAPIRAWLKHDLREQVEEYLGDNTIRSRGLFNPDEYLFRLWGSPGLGTILSSRMKRL